MACRMTRGWRAAEVGRRSVSTDVEPLLRVRVRVRVKVRVGVRVRVRVKVGVRVRVRVRTEVQRHDGLALTL
jgi:hypothetical protein